MKNTIQVRERIERAFNDWIDNPEAGRDIAFHMTDWDHNLEDLIKFYSAPDLLTDDQVQSVVIEFLAHVPNHVAAAKKLSGLGPIEDVFDLGVLVEDDE